MRSVPVLIISGSVGAGKSSVAAAISEMLVEQSVAHALIDLDYLRWAFPRPKYDPFHMVMGFKNLGSVWKNYHQSGVDRLIIPSVVENRSELDSYREAIPGADILVVRLRVKLATIHERLKSRETGKSLDWHLNRAMQLTAQLEQTQAEDITIDTGNKSLVLVAQEVMNKWND